MSEGDILLKRGDILLMRGHGEDKNIQKVQPVGLVKKDIVDRPQDKANEDEKERCCDGQKGTKPIEKRHGWVFTLAYLAFGLLFTLAYLAGYQVRHTGSMQMEDHDKGIKIQIEIPRIDLL